MGLDVGSIVARAALHVDDDGFNRFERRLDGARRDARNDVKAHAKLDADTRGFDTFDRRLNQTERHADHTGRTFGRLGKSGASLGVAMGGAAAAGVAGLGLAVVKATGEFEESAKVTAQTEAVIKSTGGAANVTAKQIGDMATAISNKTGIDDEAIQSGENMLLTFTNLRNEAGKGNDVFNQATSTLTDMSVALGVDAKTQAIQLGKALNDPIKGITALQRVGVTFTDSQKDQIKALVDSGKTMEAQKLILRELNKEFGGSAEAQARPLERAKTAVNNLFEALGGALAPAVTFVANKLANFTTALLTGEGAGTKLGRTLGRITGAARDVGQWVGRAFNTVRDAFTGGNDDATKLGRNVTRYFGMIVGAARELGRFIGRTFSGSSGIGGDLATIGRAWLKMAGIVSDVARAIARRYIPAITRVLEGFALIVRGVIRIISGILSGDFGKAWDGVKDIFRGAMRALGGILRGAVGLLGDAAGVAFRGIISVARKLPGTLGGFAADAASAVASRLISGLSSLPGRIRGLFSGIGGIIGDIGGAIANWLNANTPLGDRVSIKILGHGVSFTLPALRRGGKAGPGEGGPAVVYGEGARDEWWISQEGDRRQNIGWGVEALEALTGRNVAFYRSGGKKAGASKARRAPKAMKKASRAVRGIAKREHGFAVLEERINNWNDSFDTLERTFALDDTDLLIENDDGSTTPNQAAIDNRVKDLNTLASLRKAIADELLKYKKKIAAAVTAYLKAIKTLKKALAAAKGKKNRDNRDNYRTLIEDYEARVEELGGTGALKGKITGGLWYEVNNDENDSRLDYIDLITERDAVAGTTGEPAPSTDAGGSGSGVASAEDVARAAAEQAAAFQSNRAALFGSYGSNFVLPGAGLSTATAQAAGLRYFGAASEGGSGGQSGPTINQTFNFAEGPPDAMTFSQQVDHEMKAAVR